MFREQKNGSGTIGVITTRIDAATAISQYIDCFATKRNAILQYVIIECMTDWAGGTITIGDAYTSDRYASNSNIPKTEVTGRAVIPLYRRVDPGAKIIAYLGSLGGTGLIEVTVISINL